MNSHTAFLAKSITCASSKQSYYTARLMVDKDLVEDCYRAYGYFRWADDIVDVVCKTRSERMDFIQRQLDLVNRIYAEELILGLTPEEEILADLICHDRRENDLLRSYITNFLAIIAFDAERKGRLISQQELDWYARTLGKAVTDGIQYFVCNGHPYPDDENRYLAAAAAHITHMLRDLVEDVSEGYVNIPQEILGQGEISLGEYEQPEFREWVKERVAQARSNFADGKQYLDNLAALRCKIVGYWYCARFERVLDQIERDGYVLRPEYKKAPKLLTWGQYLWMGLMIAGKHYFSAFHDSLVEKYAAPGQEVCGFPRLAVD